MNHSHSKPVVSSQLDYSKIKQTIAATVQEQSFLPIGNSDFSYSGTQEIVIKLATATDGAFADMKHSYLRMKVNNTNTYDIFFDGLASSIIQDFTVSINGISAETIQDYNVLMNSLMAHFGSASFSKELAITSGAPNAPLSSGAFDISSTAGTNYGTQIIKAGSSTIVSIPVVSAFLQSRIMTLTLPFKALIRQVI